MQRRTARFSLVTILAMFGLATSACGGGDDTPPPPPSTPAPPVPAPLPVPPPLPPPPAPVPGVGPTWTDLVLPREVPGWALQAPQDQGPATGYIVDYQHDGAGVRASIFVYHGGRQGIRRDPALLSEELSQATQGVHRAREAGAYEAVRELARGETRLGAGPSAPFALIQPLIVTNGGVERESTILLSTHRAFFVKIRFTVQRGPSPAVEQAMSEMRAAIGAALREDAAGGGTVVTVDGQPVAPPPASPGCDVGACCAAAQQVERSVGLFCQLTAATGGSCADQLGRVRSYLTERGAALPPACQ